ncbi:MAG: penicillin-binding protein [Microthrixaceae bacterium]|nr:penicillin-binding protein [Microthrixaceae bacterium]
MTIRFLAILAVGSVSLGLLGAQLVPAVGSLGGSMSYEQTQKVALPALVEGSKILDMNGEPMGKLVGAENRVIVPLDSISLEMRKTLLAVEDADFYRHNGVSARSIARALRANSDAGSVSQGGSTITQQLVKLTLVGNEQSMARKVREASLALQLESQVCENRKKVDCKNTILSQYLNTVYLGRGTYGVEAAARLYFNKSASELDWADAAMLTALVRNPNGYDPVRHSELATERRRIVTLRMVEQGLIDETQAQMINLSPLPRDLPDSAAADDTAKLSYFERHIRDELLNAEWLAPNRELRKYLIFNGGLTITSTYDPRAQLLAIAASESNPIKKANPDSVAVVASVEPSTGAVRAVVGEQSIPGKGVVELAEPALGRSPGSAFKTFTLIAALEDGRTMRDTISAAPAPSKLVKNWGIKGSTWPSGCKGGSITLAKAISSSNNCAFARLQASVGGDKVVDVAHRLGLNTVDSTAGEYPSLTLGSTTVRPLEMAGAYAAIANNGVWNPPHFVTKVTDRDGKVLYEYKPATEQAIPSDVAQQATEGLEGVVRGGTYSGGRLSQQRPAAGKTGTNETSDGSNTDVWFVGFTPQIATAVWIGDPAGQIRLKGGKVQGGNTAGKVWFNFMEPYLKDMPVEDFPTPPKSKTRAKYITDPWQKSYSKSETAKASGQTKSSAGSKSSTAKKTTTTTTKPASTQSTTAQAPATTEP